MDNKKKEPVSESLWIGVFELPGEPAIVINGVPSISSSDNTLVLSGTASDAESQRSTSLNAGIPGHTSFGDEWLVGREVQKLFGDQYYTGTVTQLDKETGWYRVVYEDGDFEDLDWRELEAVLVPLDITVPLKSLALKVIKKSQKTVHKYGKNAFQSSIGKVKSAASKGTEDHGT